jgi:hypothetical protein
MESPGGAFNVNELDAGACPKAFDHRILRPLIESVKPTDAEVVKG